MHELQGAYKQFSEGKCKTNLKKSWKPTTFKQPQNNIGCPQYFYDVVDEAAEMS